MDEFPGSDYQVLKRQQTWNGGRLWRSLWRGGVCQVCRKSADLERKEAAENAPAGVSVPGLLKLRKPGTATGHREASGEGECSKSAETPQTWNGERPQRTLRQG